VTGRGVLVPSGNRSSTSRRRNAPLVACLLLAVLLLLGLGPYAGVNFGNVAITRWFGETAPHSALSLSNALNVIAGLGVWDAAAIATAITAWLRGLQMLARALIAGLSIELVAVVAKAVFLIPWIVSHAAAHGGYIVAISVPGQVTGQNAATPSLRYVAAFPAAGTYSVRVRLSGDHWGTNSVSLGIDDKPQDSAKSIFVLPDRWWHWGSTRTNRRAAYLEVPSAGAHVVTIWARAPGVRIDRLELSNIASPALFLEVEAFQEGLQTDAPAWQRRTGLPDRFPSLLVFTIRTADMPSAHVARVVVMLGLVITFVSRKRQLLRIGLVFATVLVVGAVACSRILTNAHTPMGSLAGIVLGLMWLQWLVCRSDHWALTRP
jgi:membrane-associated phospholipid phosphatase